MTRKIMGMLACILVAAVNGFAEEGRWMLLSRHMVCAPISVLARKVPDMGTVTSPDQFVRMLQARGYDMKRTDVPGAGVAVEVPALGLSPMFVPYESCTEFERKDPKVGRGVME